ncbi:hypothetical protein EMIHUDRAFT_118228 [Emiliania huxleyi CCMP1516]|uniref:YprB ribonuclease H-like domain-containing protein n=2 Tax=Emiliania huxleyi TaxID=2903 RepID=A0A0D3J664_EMIH1|nr:hypothetical protein EMIHUDRAFT_118228 [Emiliania huxleyi CCMP1516]EOD18999.1 hypothetical protein EMIHUDRAFT_118228 [Emiliania huxleyi CCMP1516]|eukprot:XP_005771428.1 hypothetical protein EMIHUDRAFT_118228 [Emiliania huxleyi CCMP1516]
MRLVAPIARSTLAHSSRLWTPSDLVQYYESPFASWMDRLAAEHPAHPLAARRDPPDPFLSMLGKKGMAGEQEAMRKLFLGLGLGVADLSAEARGDALAQRALVTAEAMRERPDVIYQAPLAAGSFAGVADFLVRSDLLGRDEASRGDPALYTVWDAKLTRHVRPQQLIQLCCYAEMLAEMQGARPETVSLVLGGSAARVASFRLAEHRAHFASLRRRFLAFHAGFDAAAEPPAAPTRSAPAGQWRGLADAELLARDDLRLVARLSQRQAALLSAAGVRSAAALAELPPGQAVGGVERAALSRLREQASLQLQARGAPDEPPPYRLLPWSRAAGLALLPPPSPSDLFFDLEGFPLAEGHAPEGAAAPPERLADFAANGAADEAARGREYLWGAATRGGHVAASAAAGGGGGVGAALFENDDEFVAWWAHSYAQEKAALEGFVDWAVSLKRSEPRMHIYHYGAYEVSALRRLAMRHATREAEVDELLRGGALVDLYAVVRGGLLLGTENYSIKSVQFDALHDVLIHNPKGLPAITKADGRIHVADKDGRSWQFDLFSRRESIFCSKHESQQTAQKKSQKKKTTPEYRCLKLPPFARFNGVVAHHITQLQQQGLVGDLSRVWCDCRSLSGPPPGPSTANKSAEETAALRNRLVEAREKRKREREEAEKAYAKRRGSTSADNA